MHRHVLAACAGGHVGYEMAPLIPTLEAAVWGLLSWGAPAKGLNTVAHHDLHHRCPGGWRGATTLHRGCCRPEGLPHPGSLGAVGRTRITRRDVHVCRAVQCRTALALLLHCRILFTARLRHCAAVSVRRVHQSILACNRCGRLAALRLPMQCAVAGH